MQKNVDIIVPVWNPSKEVLPYTKICLNSIISKTVNYNLIIVDNGSEKETQEYLMNFATENENVYVLRQEVNKGYVGAANIAVEYARKQLKSPLIAFITSDTIAPTGWVDSMSEYIKDDVVMVGPTSNNVSGRQHIRYNNAKYGYEYAEWLIGFFTLMRADIVDQLIDMDGYYHDEQFNYGSSDDLDLSVRIRKMGYRLCIDRKTYVHHFLSKSLSQLDEVKKTSLQDMHNKFFTIFQKKHGFNFPEQKDPYVLIGVPMASNMLDHLFWKSTMTLNMPFKTAVETCPREMPDTARNRLAEIAIEYGFSHLLVLDDDQVYDDPDILVKLVSANKDIIGVRAYTRKPPHYPCVFYKTETGFYQEMDFESCGLREIDALGMAVTLINVDVFRTMPRPWFEFKQVKMLGQEDAKFGEDINFCEKAKALGFKVWVDTDIEVGHLSDPPIITRKSYHAAIKKR